MNAHFDLGGIKLLIDLFERSRTIEELSATKLHKIIKFKELGLVADTEEGSLIVRERGKRLLSALLTKFNDLADSLE